MVLTEHRTGYDTPTFGMPVQLLKKFYACQRARGRVVQKKQSAADYDCMASWNLKLFTAKLEAGELIQDRIHCIANRNQSQVKYH